jgi:hypothetical protein
MKKRLKTAINKNNINTRGQAARGYIARRDAASGER